jgi:N-acetylmuramoyl-L-alanine amidase
LVLGGFVVFLWRIVTHLRPQNLPLENRPVAVIDAGHGTMLAEGILDTGATRFGLREADLVMDLAERLRRALEQRGWVAIPTRDSAATPLTLAQRTALAQQVGADVFVSLHLNSSPSPSPQGVSVFYWRPESEALAALLQRRLSQRLRLRDRGIERATFTVLVTATMPSVLVELGFLSNPKEAQRLSDPAFRAQAAEVMAEALGEWWAKRGEERR